MLKLGSRWEGGSEPEGPHSLLPNSFTAVMEAKKGQLQVLGWSLGSWYWPRVPPNWAVPSVGLPVLAGLWARPGQWLAPPWELPARGGFYVDGHSRVPRGWPGQPRSSPVSCAAVPWDMELEPGQGE